MLPAEMGSAGLASACIAANLNKDCLLEYEMKINYPEPLSPFENLHR
jgi:hypothetical protein